MRLPPRKSIIFPTTEASEFRHLLVATNARVRDAQLRPRANVHWRQQWRFTYTFAWINLAKLRLISQLQVSDKSTTPALGGNVTNDRSD